MIASLMLAVSCDNPAPSEEQFRTWVEERYAEPFRNARPDLWAEAFGEDAVGLHHTLPALEGREAIRDFGRMVHDNLLINQFELTVNEVRVRNEIALTRGSFVSHFVPREVTDSSAAGLQEAPTIGKFLLVWERQDDGEWRIIFDMGNLDSP